MALAQKQLDTSDTDSEKRSTMTSRINTMVENSVVSDENLSDNLSGNIAVHNMSVKFPCEKCIGELEAKAFIAILQEAVTNLEILRGTLRKPKSNDSQTTKSGPPSRIIMRKKNSCSEKNEMEMFFGKDVGLEPVVLSIQDKLLRDRDLAYNFFDNVAYELERNNSCDFLINEVGTIIKLKEKESQLKVNLKIWSDLVSKLRSSQINLKEDFEINKKKYLKEISELAQNIDNSYCANIEKLDYIIKWETSKLEQQNMRLSLQEEEVRNEIKKLEKARAIDAKVSDELRIYGQSVINAYENDIVDWTNRYNNEMERRQIEINAVEDNIKEINTFLLESRKLYDERQIVVDKDLEEKNRENEKIEYWKTINDWATVIQAVWRGYMVRHKLGPFAKLGYKKPKKSKRSKRSKSKKNKLKKSKNEK
ncbi:PREDICTED: IQ domain-containing protein D-like [Ceratosolen solmsi marchali]|uniref:Dynein regulatory complex protein 9 n=1 Tax=Ceratosolen solmsi marchali TaxID=326594 RepID=A0AAJ6YU52_9HYME|nr:PREDICTED: IQ domain-containing protein D-like [Ceratosolen solmsi marchali]